MGDKIVYRPEPEHRCSPHMDTQHLMSPGTSVPVSYKVVPPVGTVWECECGRLWRVYPLNIKNMMTKRKWERAGWLTRFRWRT